MNKKNTKRDVQKKWKSPLISKLEVISTKGGSAPKNQENNNFYTFGGAAS